MADSPDMKKAAGTLPPWNVTDLPKPPPFGFKNAMAILGPGAIALSMSIGTGEWILGPSVVVNYGPTLMWIVMLGILFQLSMNLEFIRYTVYTGEPAANGFMRSKPHPGFWAIFYIFLAICQVGWPAWAKGAASIIFAIGNGRLPETPSAEEIEAAAAAGTAIVDDSTALFFMGMFPFFATLVIVSVGGKIESMLEWINKIMVVFVVGFLLVVNIMYVKPQVWLDVLTGHFAFTFDGGFSFLGEIAGSEAVDYVLLASLAGFAASGGMTNVWTSNWIRDKGIGMGSVVGYIPSMIGGRKINLSPVGSIFPNTPENLSRWKTWWKYVHVDQTLVWMVGCFVGMYLNVVLASEIVPKGTDMTGGSVGAVQAQFLAERGGMILWYTTLMTGFWIMFGTQLAVVDGFVRLSTDLIWSGSAKARDLAKGDIRKIYYVLIIIFAIWGSIAMHLQGGTLVKIAANVAGFSLVIAGIHILILNKRVLPKEIQGPWFLKAAVFLGVIFYAAFAVMSIGQKLGFWGEASKIGGGH